MQEEGRPHRRGGIGAGSEKMSRSFPRILPGSSFGPLWEGGLDQNCFC